ncbi:MAG: tyrosine-type recombinase/integrase, partial [Chitinivibrionales bacterium]|nr:tyrosine-type recombinase/integrase [Chitinivibrionales bacterium]MBD3358860.1 tyrosine-type recombinase/integrase [Chitinivibrionales bacterium]
MIYTTKRAATLRKIFQSRREGIRHTMRQWKSPANSLPNANEGSSSLGAAVDTFLDYLRKERGFSEHTVNAYRRDLEQFRLFVGRRSGNSGLNESMNRYMIRGFTFSLTEKGLKPRSIARKIAALKSFSRYCVKRKFLATNPAAASVNPKLDKPLPSSITRKQADTLGAAPPDPAHARDKAIVELFYGTGIRLGELHELTVGALDRRGGMIRVLGKGRKERIVPVTPDALDLIDAYLHGRKDARGFDAPLFTSSKGRRLSRRQIQRIVQRELGAVSRQKKRSPHVLRHSYATHLM